MTKPKGSMTMVAMICCLLCLLLGIGYGVNHNSGQFRRPGRVFDYSGGVAEVRQALLNQSGAVPQGYIRITNSGAAKVPFHAPVDVRPVPIEENHRSVGF